MFASLDPLETPNRYAYVMGNPINDALGELIGLINGYNYATGNPINLTDLDGLCPIDPLCWIFSSSSLIFKLRDGNHGAVQRVPNDQ